MSKQSSKEEIKVDHSNLSTEEIRNIIEEWKTVIQTQMHFNDLLMKVRTATVSVVLAVFGAAGYSLQFDNLVRNIGYIPYIGVVKIHTAVGVIIVGLAILIAMFVIDYRYYYKMLVGAVKRGYEFDEEFSNMADRKYFGLSSMIRDEIGKPTKSKIFVWFFYGLPIGAGGFFLYLVVVGYSIIG